MTANRGLSPPRLRATATAESHARKPAGRAPPGSDDSKPAEQKPHTATQPNRIPVRTAPVASELTRESQLAEVPSASTSCAQASEVELDGLSQTAAVASSEPEKLVDTDSRVPTCERCLDTTCVASAYGGVCYWCHVSPRAEWSVLRTEKLGLRIRVPYRAALSE
eukprot:4651337-Prymnesium_polylepis.1